MSGQANTSIDNVLSVRPRPQGPQPRGESHGDDFRQLLERSDRGRSSGRHAPSSDDSLRAREGSDTRETNRNKEASSSGERTSNPESREKPSSGESEARAADDAQRPKTDSGKEAVTEDKNSEQRLSNEKESDKEALARRLEDADEVLESLSVEELKGLSEDMVALLDELKTKLEAGELEPELEQAVRTLLADLESGASLDDIVAQLDAIAVQAAPDFAARFPGADTLRDALGRDGAAYLKRLADAASARLSPSDNPTQQLSPTPPATETVGELDLEGLLDAAKAGRKAAREEGAQWLEALARGRSDGGRGSETAAQTKTNEGAPALSLEPAGSQRSQPVAPTERGFTIQSDVRVPVGQSQWGEAVGQRVLWMASQKLSSAELQLDPPDLGPVQVRVSSHQDQISITFTSQQAGVREALDQNAARLREMFSEQGLDLVDVNVSDQSGDESMADGDQGGSDTPGEGEEAPPTVMEQILGDRLVDHYA